MFKETASFEKVIQLYNFDRELRLLVFNMVERIEIGIRTRLIYHLSLSYGAHWFEDSTLFRIWKFWKKNIEEIKGEIERSKEVFITQHKQKYAGDHRCPPAWKTLEVVSFGMLSKLYKNLRDNLPEKKAIARNLYVGSHKILASWLLSITVIRNICAHHGRLWNRNLPIAPKLLKKSALPWINTLKEVDVHSFYAVFSCLYYLLQTVSPGNQFKQRFVNLLDKYPHTDIAAMGFPPAWQDEPLFAGLLGFT